MRRHVQRWAPWIREPVQGQWNEHCLHTHAGVERCVHWQHNRRALGPLLLWAGPCAKKLSPCLKTRTKKTAHARALTEMRARAVPHAVDDRALPARTPSHTPFAYAVR